MGKPQPRSADRREVRAGWMEQLEERRLMSATVDIRLAGGGQSATVTNVGQVINFEIWVNVTGANSWAVPNKPAPPRL